MNLFIYFVDGHVIDLKQPDIVFSVDITAICGQILWFAANN